ncbi:uncharacterized protein LOC118413456 isoform X2 [Branchiostoma floridae]|nr:uncharacterized protein LOC118413456 isoform X2 [Branchiostoma floridae]XP_035672738.1 uncharacterized protein LOC118413456 isoform X2 [Branchiostoma floridae]
MKYVSVVLLLACLVCVTHGGWRPWLTKLVRNKIAQDVSDRDVCHWCFLCGEDSIPQYTKYRLSRHLCQMCREDCGPPCNTTCTQELLDVPAMNASMTAMMGDMSNQTSTEMGMHDIMDHLQELEYLEPTCGARTAHWRLTGQRVMLEYHGGDQRMALGFSDETLDGLMEDPDFTDDCPEFMSKMGQCELMDDVVDQFPSMMSDMMSEMVPDCHAMVNSFNCTDDMEMSQSGDTMMEMGDNWAIKTYPCTLEYSPIVRRGFWRWIIVNGRPLRMKVQIRFG